MDDSKRSSGGAGGAGSAAGAAGAAPGYWRYVDDLSVLEHVHTHRPKLFDFCTSGTKWLSALANLIKPEYWGQRYSVLSHYTTHVFARVLEEKKVLVHFTHARADLVVFNIGMLSHPLQERLFVAIEPRGASDADERRWQLMWRADALSASGGGVVITETTLISKERFMGCPPAKEPMWVADPRDLFFDPSRKLVVDYDHLFASADHDKRSASAVEGNPAAYRAQVGEAIRRARGEAIVNFRLAIPQFYGGSIQLLLPVYLDPDSDVADAALVLKRGETVDPETAEVTEFYSVTTWLPLSWAYENARLVCRVDDSWLRHGLMRDQNDALALRFGAPVGTSLAANGAAGRDVASALPGLLRCSRKGCERQRYLNFSARTYLPCCSRSCLVIAKNAGSPLKGVITLAAARERLEDAGEDTGAVADADVAGADDAVADADVAGADDAVADADDADAGVFAGAADAGAGADDDDDVDTDAGVVAGAGAADADVADADAHRFDPGAAPFAAAEFGLAPEQLETLRAIKPSEPSICLPWVRTDVKEAFVCEVFGRYGDIVKVDFAAREDHYRVFIHFERWFWEAHPQQVRWRLMTNGGKDPPSPAEGVTMTTTNAQYKERVDFVQEGRGRQYWLFSKSRSQRRQPRVAGRGRGAGRAGGAGRGGR